MADNKYLYEKMPVGKAVISLALPTVLSQIVHVIYNMADTFFIGQLNDTAQVAAATLAMPLFILMAGIANLLGIGGSSLISRSLGVGDRSKAEKTASFCIWTAGAIAVAYGLLLIPLKPYLLPFLGTTETTYDYCYEYLFWTVTVGSVPSVLSTCLAHLIRAQGLSKQAAFGMALGGVLNIILDPIFLFALKMDLVGAAIATTISSVISFIYFIIVIYRRRRELSVSANPKLFTLKEGIPKEVFMVGLPNFAMNLMAILSGIFLNVLMSSYSDAAISGMGIAKKIDTLTFAVAMGMTQGVISLIGYNYAAKNYKRMIEAVKKCLLYTMIMAVITTVFLYFCAVPVSRFFIDDGQTVEYGQEFLKVICIICPMQTISLASIMVFQAVGKKAQPLILSFMRKGAIDIPLMFLLNRLVGIMGIPWATPISEMIACIVAIIITIPLLKRFKTTADKEDSVKE